MPAEKQNTGKTRRTTTRKKNNTIDETAVIDGVTAAETTEPVSAEQYVTTAQTPAHTIPDIPIEPVISAPIEEIAATIADTETVWPTFTTRRITTGGESELSKKVLARIASLATGEIDGLAPPRRDPLVKIIDSFKGRLDGIRVDVGTTEAAVDMLVRVRYGSHIPDITNRLREKIAERINQMTGLNVVEINIRVQDIMPVNTITD